jgi:hypothetical protein
LGSAIAIGFYTAGSVGSSSGEATALGVGAYLFSVVGSSDGIGSGTGISSVYAQCVASAVGISTVLGYGENALGFPIQYPGLRVYYGGSVKELCLVSEGDFPSSMGGALKLKKGASIFSVYLVETGDGNASLVRLKTTAGVKALRLKT